MTEEKCIVCGSSKDRHGDVFACRDFRCGDWQKEHVEPSAAESENEVYQQGYLAGHYDGKVEQQNAQLFITDADKARMLELALREDNGWIDNEDLMKLRALVIETFGVKK